MPHCWYRSGPPSYAQVPFGQTPLAEGTAQPGHVACLVEIQEEGVIARRASCEKARPQGTGLELRGPADPAWAQAT
jgi:hypothetical protein